MRGAVSVGVENAALKYRHWTYIRFLRGELSGVKCSGLGMVGSQFLSLGQAQRLVAVKELVCDILLLFMTLACFEVS